MKFLVRKRRTAPAVIIVALIDVLIVLVIFLLVTTTFKQQPAFKLALPDSTKALKEGAGENPPLIVSIDEHGSLRFGVGSLPVTQEQLRSQLLIAVEKARAAGQEPKLAVRADKNAPWGKVVTVMDLAKEANIKILSAFTKETGKP
jgi:biopolymer transport protein ExbD